MVANNDEERISALLDDELDLRERDTALDWLARDPQASARWSRYNLIRDTLHKNLPQTLSGDLAQRVHEALEQEPHILAPQRSRHWSIPAVAKQAAGLAIAASVTAVAILGVQQLNSGAPGSAPPAVAKNDVPVMPDKQQFERLPVVAQNPVGPEPVRPESALNPYLVKHNEYASSAGMQGMLPYVRIVGQRGE